MPVADVTLEIKSETMPEWMVRVKVLVEGKPVGANEAEVTLQETTPWVGILLRKNYGPVKTDANGVATFTGVSGAYYLFGVKLDNIYYDVVAKLLVDKGPFKAGTVAKKRLVIQDGTWSDPPEVICEACGGGVPLGPWDVITCPRCGAQYSRY